MKAENMDQEYSSQRKREILWNVLEPGDPYDIRK
jgi:hypothetical protein